MNRFVRPEARAALWRWREVLAGAALIALGIWWIVGPGQLMTIIGSVTALAGSALSYIGLQRGRFRGRVGGIGSVDVDEGQVTYFGPLTGGAVALRDVRELALLRTGVTTHWRLSTAEDTLHIPVDADGADALFDAFAALPGLNVERMLAALKDRRAGDVVIWPDHRDGAPPQLH